VQGNRTCGINHRPDEAFLDRLAERPGLTRRARRSSRSSTHSARGSFGSARPGWARD
jgi:hypothetical protein